MLAVILPAGEDLQTRSEKAELLRVSPSAAPAARQPGLPHLLPMKGYPSL